MTNLRRMSLGAVVVAMNLAVERPSADPALPPDQRVRTDTVAKELSIALEARSAAAVARRLQAPLRYAGFDGWGAPACEKTFGREGTVTSRRLRRFAACLLQAGVAEDSVLLEDEEPERDAAYAHPPRYVRYKTGTTGERLIDSIELISVGDGVAGVVAGPVVVGAQRPAPQPPRGEDLIPEAEIVGQLIDFEDPPDPDRAVLRKMQERRQAAVAARVKLCFAPSGRVESAALVASSHYPTWDGAAMTAGRTWRLAPFAIDETTRPVCTTATFRHPRRMRTP